MNCPITNKQCNAFTCAWGVPVGHLGINRECILINQQISN